MMNYSKLALAPIVLAITLLASPAWAANLGDCSKCDMEPTDAQRENCKCPGPANVPNKVNTLKCEKLHEKKVGNTCRCELGFGRLKESGKNGPCLIVCKQGETSNKTGDACIKATSDAPTCCPATDTDAQVQFRNRMSAYLDLLPPAKELAPLKKELTPERLNSEFVDAKDARDELKEMAKVIGYTPHGSGVALLLLLILIGLVVRRTAKPKGGTGRTRTDGEPPRLETP